MEIKKYFHFFIYKYLKIEKKNANVISYDSLLMIVRFHTSFSFETDGLLKFALF